MERFSVLEIVVTFDTKREETFPQDKKLVCFGMSQDSHTPKSNYGRLVIFFDMNKSCPVGMEDHGKPDSRLA